MLHRGPGRAISSLLLVGVLGLSLSVEAAARACAGVRDVGPWTVIDAPNLDISAYAVDPVDTDRIFATDGDSVMRSTDGGCAWQRVYVASEEATFAGPAITQIAIPASPGAHVRTYLLVVERAGGVSRPHVVRSSDGGRSWRVSDAGLPPAGEPRPLVISPSNPQEIYLGIDAGGVLNALYASSDAGTSWQLRGAPAELAGKRMGGITVDPLEAATLWAPSDNGLYRSTDGGRSFAPIDDFADGVATGPVNVFHAPAQDARVLVYLPGRDGFAASIDGGKTWLGLLAPGDVQSIASGYVDETLMVAANGTVYGFHAPSLYWVNLKPPISGAIDLTADRGASAHFYGHNDDAIVVWTGGEVQIPPDIVKTVLRDLPLIRTPQIPEPEPPRFSRDRRRVELGPGQSKKVRYTLSLPTRPIPADVFFLLDTSGSMEGLVTSMAEGVAGIANGITSEDIDVRFGLGEFRNYPDSFPPRENDEPNFVYRRRLDLGASGSELGAVLESLNFGGGGHYNAHLGALYQLSTGAGEDLYPPGPLGSDIPPGQQANFTKGRLHVVIVATDEEFTTNDEAYNTDPTDPPPPDIPSFVEVANLLAARDTMVVGVSISSEATPDLARMAHATGAVAPGGGVDCDGDGAADLPEGAPLVCTLPGRAVESGGSVAGAIVDLVKAVRTSRDVEIDVARGAAVVQNITPRAHRNVVVQTTPRLTFDVTYRCTGKDIGERFDVLLRARVERWNPTTDTRVICRENPVFDLPFALAPIVAAVVVPPPPPPPVPEIVSQAQSQAQANVQAAAALQKEEQPQVAAVHAFRAEQEELALSAYRSRDETVPPAFVGAVGALMAAAFAWAMAARGRVRTAKASGRNTPRRGRNLY